MLVLLNTRQAHFAAVHGLDRYAVTYATRLYPMQAIRVMKNGLCSGVEQASVTGSWENDNRVR